MKVLCIDGEHPRHPHRVLPGDHIYEGEVYTVVGHHTTGEGELYYFLLERQRPQAPAYRASRFLPLTEEDEKEPVAAHSHPEELTAYTTLTLNSQP